MAWKSILTVRLTLRVDPCKHSVGPSTSVATVVTSLAVHWRSLLFPKDWNTSFIHGPPAGHSIPASVAVYAVGFNVGMSGFVGDDVGWIDTDATEGADDGLLFMVGTVTIDQEEEHKDDFVVR